MDFALDSRLQESSFFVEDWALSTLCLKNDKTLPWLYLVPRREKIKEFFDLSEKDRHVLIDEISLAGRLIQNIYAPAKINTAALGNMVPQLHVHVFGRFQNDHAWPRPVWAVQWDEMPYTEAEKNAEIQKLKQGIAQMAQEGKTACQR